MWRQAEDAHVCPHAYSNEAKASCSSATIETKSKQRCPLNLCPWQERVPFKQRQLYNFPEQPAKTAFNQS